MTVVVYMLVVYLGGQSVSPYMMFRTQDECLETARDLSTTVDLDGDDNEIVCRKWIIEPQVSGKDL